MPTLFLLFLLAVVVTAACTTPLYQPRINSSLRFCGSNFFVKDGLVVSKDNIIVDCGSAVLQGFLWEENAGVTVKDRNNVTLVDCRIVNYGTGILIKNATNIVVKDITLLRNMVGVHIINSENISISDSLDISLQRPVRFSNSSNVALLYDNKLIKGDFCKTNNCGN